MQLLTSPANEIAERWFESEAMRNFTAGHCVSGNFASLDAPGSAIPYFHHALGEFEGERGAWGHARGGMGAITQAMAASGRAHGVEYRTSAAVERILLEGGRAVGVRLEGGEEFRARHVLANTDPKRTFLKFVGRENLPAGFADGIERLRMGHATVRMNLALSGPPQFAALSGAEADLARGGSITIFPTREQIEINYRAALAGQIIDEPYLDIRIPSAIDDTLAPPGHHVMSLIGKYYPYRLAEGQGWDEIGPSVADRILEKLEALPSESAATHRRPAVPDAAGPRARVRPHRGRHLPRPPRPRPDLRPAPAPAGGAVRDADPRALPLRLRRPSGRRRLRRAGAECRDAGDQGCEAVPVIENRQTDTKMQYPQPPSGLIIQ